MNRPARFTEADLRRAVKVAEQSGRDVEVAPDGTIRIVRAADAAAGKKVQAVEPREIVIW